MTDTILILPFVTVALFFLGARTAITEPLWRRYPPKLDALMQCAMCIGFWWGCTSGAVGYAFAVPFLGLTHWAMIPITGLMSMVWTPLIAAPTERALESLSGYTQEPPA
jgi:hypothetical protein